jgi:hypothetical protein
MKKKVILLAIIVLVGFSINLFAQKDRKLHNGFSINLITGIPSNKFGVSSDSKINDLYHLGGIWGLKFGNRWYFKPKEKYGFGLMVNWVDYASAIKSGTNNGVDWTRLVMDVSFLEIGPVGTYAISKDIALDAYYNLRPTELMHGLNNSNDETILYVGLGFSHALGAAFRYKFLNFGLECVFGGINSSGKLSAPYGETELDSQKNMTNSFRIMLGVKL